MSQVETAADLDRVAPAEVGRRFSPRHSALMARQEFLRLWRGTGCYLMLAALLWIGDLAMRSFRHLVASNDVLVLNQPLAMVLVVTVVVCSLYVAFVAATSVAMDRQEGILEVLMYTPLRPVELLVGYFCAYAAAGAILAVASAGATAAVSLIMGLQPGTPFWWSLPAAALSIAEAGAIGLLISAVSSHARMAVSVLLGLALVLAGLHAAADAVVPQSPDSWLQYVGVILAGPSQIVRACSPVESYLGAAEAFGAGQYGVYAGWLGLGLARVALWMFLATRGFVRVGVRP